MKKHKDLDIKYVNIQPKMKGGSEKKQGNESMEKYLINYQKKETKYIEKNSLEYFERINNINN